MKISFLRFPLIVIAILLLVSSLNLSAQEIKLQFNSDLSFKIAQFTDTHFFIGGENSQEVLDNIKALMEAEQVDLVILTGDIVTGKPTIKSWEVLTDLLISYKVPYTVTFGNHEDEAEASRKELLTYLSERPYCVLSDEGGMQVEGIGNNILPVYNQKGIAEKLIYCMDSRSYSLAKDQRVEGYGWFDQSQIRWFAETNEAWIEKNPEAQSLLFFHIPLPEYAQAFDHGEFKVGKRKEKECSPKINTGMFAEMVLQRNVLGTFVGHDHVNNYVAQLHNIALCYGYFSGGNSYGSLPLNGARLILLEADKKTFTTWLRRVDGEIFDKVELPSRSRP
jgi:predicted MPP superfamily phosphohydrolase